MSGLFTELQRFTPQNQNEAKCSFCNQHAREKLIELPDGTRVKRRARVFRTNLHIHMEGWVEVCEWCLAEGAKAIGWVSETKAEHLRELYDEADAALQVALGRMEDKDSTIRTLSQSLSIEAEDHAAKVKQSYDRGYDQGYADSKVEHAELEDADAGS